MIGQIVEDRYCIEALIGRGGMGAVYRATDLIKHQPVALKFLHLFLDMETETALTRFYREFRVLARLDHPGIVRAYGDGTHEGAPYLVLELLAGQTLKDKLAAGPLPRTHLLAIARQICQALVYLHAQSIVHRDLKPGNLMLLPPDDDPQVKLMDFGLVRLADLSRQLTQEGVALGTVAYMAPEQAQGLPVDFRADLYALGVILYEMATGRPPFVHENPAMLLMQQLTTSPPAPRRFKPDLDESLEQSILQLLAKEPAQRPANTELVAARLAHLADETAPTPSPLPKRVDLIPRVPLIGREAALNEWTQHWTTVQAGQGRVLLLAGAAGAGKTRLLTEASLQVRLGNDRFLHGHCREHTSLPYQPLVDMLDTLLADLPASIRNTLPLELARLLPSVSTDMPSQVIITDQAEARLHIFAACWQLLCQAAQTKTLMMVIENGQWANPTTLELLGYLAQRIEQTRIMLVLTYRPEEVEANGSLATLLQGLQRSLVGHSITLDLLTQSQVADFLKAALGQQDIPPWLVDSFHQATDGNPLFLEETLKMLAAEGQVAHWVHRESSQSRWASIPSTTLQLPQSVLALAERRLQALTPEDRTILTTAAVLGPEFPFVLLQEVTRQDEDALIDAIDRLLAARLIQELPLRDGEDYYRFAQEAGRQALLNTISRRRLRTLHRRTGEAMRELFDTGQSRHWPALAYHFSEAGDTSQALKYFTLAGDAAAKVYANAEAVAHYSHALEIAKAEMERGEVVDSDRLIHLYTERGRSLELDGQYEKALHTYEEMKTLAHERADRPLELAALLAQATIRSLPTSVHDLDRGQTLSEQALSLARELGDYRSEAKALWNLLFAHLQAGRPREAMTCGEQGLTIARTHNLTEQLALILNDIQLAYLAVGQPERCRRALNEARALWRELGNLPMQANNLGYSAVIYFLGGDFERTRTLAEEMLHIAQRIDSLWGQVHSRWMTSLVHAEYGQLDTAIEALEDAIRLGDQGDLILPQAVIRADLGWIYGCLGAIEPGLKLARLARDKAKELPPGWRAYSLGLLARLYLLKGDLTATEAAIKEGYVGLNIEEPSSFAAIWIALAEVELAFVKQDYQQLNTEVDQFVTHLRRMDIRAFIPDALHLKGQALLALDQAEDAYAVLAEARVEAETLGSRRTLWPILFALSQIEAQRGNPVEADNLRKQAREIVDYIAGHIKTPDSLVSSGLDLRASFLALPHVRTVMEDEPTPGG